MQDDAEKVFMINVSKGLTRTILATLLFSLAALARQASPSTPDPRGEDALGIAMRKLGVHTILLLQSQAVDEMPLWSPDSRFVAVDVEGKWYKLDTWAITALGTAKWHGEEIGAVKDELRSNATAAQVNRWKGKSQNDPREVVSKSGIKVQLTQHEEDLSTSFVVSKGSRTRTLWTSGMENCYSPMFSPNEKYVAFICELNGVFVTDVEAAFNQPSTPAP
jgi:Tol biopolymer transport system component